MTTADVWARTPLPSMKSIRDVLEGMLGRGIDLATGAPVVPRPTAPATVGIYASRADSVRAVIVMDLPLSAYLSAAIGLFAVDVAEQAVVEKSLRDDCKENLGEVLNVMTASLNAPDSPHVSLKTVSALGDVLPMDAAILLRTLGRRVDLDISIHGYGSGSMSIVCI